MASSDTSTSILAPISRLAERVERDILTKGLSYGDRYFTAAEAARQFGVSTATANRAMQLLAGRDILSRERSRGTFIGSAVTQARKCQVRTVVVLFRANDKGDLANTSCALLESLRKQFSPANIHFGFIPDQDSVSHAQAFLEPMLLAGHIAGIIAISCPREVYYHLGELNLPLVIMGSLYAEGRVIPSVDADNRQSGRLLAKYLIEKGHHRFVLFSGHESLPGEHDFHDGLCEVLTEKNMPATALLMRSLPENEAAAGALLRHLLHMDDAPTGYICRGADALQFLARELRVRIPSDHSMPEVVCDGYQPSGSEPFPYVQASPRADLNDVTNLISTMLRKLSEGKPLESDRVVVPVELHVGAKFIRKTAPRPQIGSS